MWIVIFVNFLGALMVAAHESMWANKIWFVSNPILIGYNFYIGSYEQMTMFILYWVVCILGITRKLEPTMLKIKEELNVRKQE
jgi:hypothetical protein